MIFKFQQSLFSSTGKPQALIYNKDRSITYEGELVKEIKMLFEERPKVYFECDVLEDGTLDVKHEVEEQDW